MQIINLLLLLFSLFLPPPCPTVYKYVKEVETENLSRLLWKSFVVSSSCHSCIQYSLSTVPRPGHTSVRWADMAPPSPPARRSAAPGLAGSNQEQCWWTGQVLSQLGEQICCWLLLSSSFIPQWDAWRWLQPWPVWAETRCHQTLPTKN